MENIDFSQSFAHVFLNMSDFCIGTAQTLSVPGDMTANVARHSRCMEDAARAGVSLLLFPELSLCGYELESLADCALTQHTHALEPLRAAAAKTGVTAIVGAPVVSDLSKPYIGALTIRPDGRVEVYCKQNLHAGEEVYALASNAPVQSHWCAGAHYAHAICADTAHAHHARAAADTGAFVYMAGVLVSQAGYPQDTATLKTYAQLHRMAVVMANHGGPTGGYTSAGKSAIWTPDGKLLVQAPGTGECLVAARFSDGQWSGSVETISMATC